ncbi:MAG: hypothetical protein ABIP03_01300 [Aquihabitans sp.]
MEIIVNGTSYPTWDEVPQHLKTAIANSGSEPAPEPPPPPGAPDVNDLDQLVDLAEAAELRRAQGLPPLEPAHPISPLIAEPAAPSPVFELNGRRYQSIEDVPGEIREALRHELLATPVPALEPRLPRALAAELGSSPVDPPAPLASIPTGDSKPGASPPPVTASTDPLAPKPPMISRPYKIAMGVMITMIVAIYLALSLLA